MARKLTQVSFPKFIKTAEKLGMTVSTKKGWTKVFPANGSVKRSLGIPNTKLVTRIELIGFESTEFGVAHPKPPASTVTQMLDFGQDEKLILRAFFKVAKSLCEAATEAAKAPEAVTEAPVEVPAVEQAESTEAPIEAEVASA
jgi:hypothetical protein